MARIGVRRTREQRLAARVWTPAPKKRRTPTYADRSIGSWNADAERTALTRLAVMQAELDHIARAIRRPSNDTADKLAAASRLRVYEQARNRFELHDRGRLFEGLPALKGRMRVTDVAVAMNMPVRTLRRWCIEGRVKATKLGGMWMLDAADVRRLLAEAGR